MPEGCVSITFSELCHASAWARQHGGWIVKSLDDNVHPVRWFCPETPQTPIIEATSDMGTREIGTWPMFAG